MSIRGLLDVPDGFVHAILDSLCMRTTDSSGLREVIRQLEVCKRLRDVSEDWLRHRNPFEHLRLSAISYCALPHLLSLQLGSGQPSGRLAGKRAHAAACLLRLVPALEQLKLANVDEDSGLALLIAAGNLPFLLDLSIEMRGHSGGPWIHTLVKASRLRKLTLIGFWGLEACAEARELIAKLPRLEELTLDSFWFDFLPLTHNSLQCITFRDLDLGPHATSIWSCFRSCPSTHSILVEECRARIGKDRIRFSATLSLTQDGVRLLSNEIVNVKQGSRWHKDPRDRHLLRQALSFGISKGKGNSKCKCSALDWSC